MTLKPESTTRPDLPTGGGLDRNIAMEMSRVTEAAALAAARWMGRGNKNALDQAAVNAMRDRLRVIQMDGVVVIGEGEKDEAPMLYIGERIGTGEPPQVDVAVDPVDGTTLLSKGLPNAVSVVALAERGTMYYPPGIVYMEKLAVGPAGRGAVSLEQSVEDNIRALAAAKSERVDDLTIVVLDRPRHAELIERIRATGARIKLISDGDVAGGIMPSLPDTGVDMLIGVGGSPEAVLTAAALKCLGGDIQCKLWPRDDKEREQAEKLGLRLDQVLTIDDLVRGNDVFFSLTGVTDGELVKGVHYFPHGATTETLVMRSRSGTVRRIQAVHNFEKLERYADLAGI
ncbi:MAG: class II fructose-bisphosphatase [Chloroflexota bacterium]|nr:class II fructose-bisphosphatase [Chloroflexota bacterium]